MPTKKPSKYVTRAECQRCKAKTLSVLADIQESQSRMTVLLQRFMEERTTKCPFSTPSRRGNGEV